MIPLLDLYFPVSLLITVFLIEIEFNTHEDEDDNDEEDFKSLNFLLMFNSFEEEAFIGFR